MDPQSRIEKMLKEIERVTKKRDKKWLAFVEKEYREFFMETVEEVEAIASAEAEDLGEEERVKTEEIGG